VPNDLDLAYFSSSSDSIEEDDVAQRIQRKKSTSRPSKVSPISGNETPEAKLQ